MFKLLMAKWLKELSLTGVFCVQLWFYSEIQYNITLSHFLLALKTLVLVSLFFSEFSQVKSLQCFDTVGWVAGRVSGL